MPKAAYLGQKTEASVFVCQLPPLLIIQYFPYVSPGYAQVWFHHCFVGQ